LQKCLSIEIQSIYPGESGGTGFQPVHRTGKMPVPPKNFQTRIYEAEQRCQVRNDFIAGPAASRVATLLMRIIRLAAQVFFGYCTIQQAAGVFGPFPGPGKSSSPSVNGLFYRLLVC
jgi:hypothetical protein